jgi:hypothetical protein
MWSGALGRVESRLHAYASSYSFDSAVGHQHHVRALEIAVHHATPVRRAEGRRQLLRQGQRVARRDPHAGIQPFAQGLPAQQLHGHEPNAVRSLAVPSQVVNAAHVRVTDRARQQRLALEPRERGAVLGEFQPLERHVDRQLVVPNRVHLAQPAGAH